MLLLLGASGYVGHAFAKELLRRRYPFVPLTRQAFNYSDFNQLFDYVRKLRPRFLVNAAGFTGNPDEDACELAREETLSANTLLPQTIARVCLMTNTPWAHVSSGSIFAGAKILDHGNVRVEKDLHRPEIRRLLAEHPDRILGFTELDEPNCTFRSGPCGFYSGTKALAEEVIQEMGPCYVWRPGLPFNEAAVRRNFLWNLQRAGRICDSINSLSHVDDFVRACLTLWERQAPFGIYHVVNPGLVPTRRVTQLIERILKPKPGLNFWEDADPNRPSAARVTHFHRLLDPMKLREARVEMRPAEDALEDALRHWQTGRPIRREFPGASPSARNYL